MADQIEVVVKTELAKLQSFRDEATSKGAFKGPGGKDALTRIDGLLDVIRELSKTGRLEVEDWKKVVSSIKTIYSELSQFATKVSKLSPELELLYSALRKKENELNKWSDKKVGAIEKRTETGRKIKDISEKDGYSFHKLTSRGNVTKSTLTDPETILKNYKAGTLAMKDSNGATITDQTEIKNRLETLNTEYETHTKTINDATAQINILASNIEQLNSKIQTQVGLDKTSGAYSDSGLISSIEQSSHSFNKISNKLTEGLVEENERASTKIDPDALKLPQQQATGWGKALKAISLYQVAIRGLRTALNAAKNTVVELDRYLTEQAMVTGKTRKETYALLESYQELAAQCGATTKEIAEVSTEYLKQGKSVQEAMVLTEAAVKAAKVARVSVGDSVNYLTTALNGFRLSAEDAMKVSDKFAAIAAASATDYDELAIALSKVASQANLAGMSIDYTTALLTKGLETTREAPETMGTALKTIIARMRELGDYGETLDDGMNINNVESQLKYVGIALRDSNGELRSTEDVLDELGHKWDSLNKNQQAAIAKALAGTRQQSRLIAMMEDYERVTELQEIAQRSQGATAAQADTYLQGMEAAINGVKVAWEKVAMAFTNSDVIIWFINRAADGLKIVGDLLKSTAGQVGVFGTIASIGLVILGNKIKEHVWAKEQLKIEREQQLLEVEKNIEQQKKAKQEAQARAKKVADEKIAGITRTTLAKIQTLEEEKQNLIEAKNTALLEKQGAVERLNAAEKKKTRAEDMIAKAKGLKMQAETNLGEQKETIENLKQLRIEQDKLRLKLLNEGKSTADIDKEIAEAEEKLTTATNNQTNYEDEIKRHDTTIKSGETQLQNANDAITLEQGNIKAADDKIAGIDKQINDKDREIQNALVEQKRLIREETEKAAAAERENVQTAMQNLQFLERQKQLLQDQLSPISKIASGIKGWVTGIKSFVTGLAKGVTRIGQFFGKFKKSKKDLDISKTSKKNTKALKESAKAAKHETKAKQDGLKVAKEENKANVEEGVTEKVATDASKKSGDADIKEAANTEIAAQGDTKENAGNVTEAVSENLAAKGSKTSGAADTSEAAQSAKATQQDAIESSGNVIEALTESAGSAAHIPFAGWVIALALLAAAGTAVALSMANVNGAFDNEYGAQKKAENINKLSGEIYELTERARALDSVVDSFENIDNKVIKTKKDIEEMNSLLEQAGDELSDEIGDDEDIGYGKGVSAQEAYKALTREEDKIAFLEAEAERNRQLANEKRQEQLKIFNNARTREKELLLHGTDAAYVNARSAIYGINNNTLYERIDALKEMQNADEEALSATEDMIQSMLEQLDIERALQIANEAGQQTIKEWIEELSNLEATEAFLNEDEKFLDRVKAYRTLKEELRGNTEMLEALQASYSEWDTFASMDDSILEFIDTMGLSIDQINELYAGYKQLQKVGLDISQEDYQERLEQTMSQLDGDLSNLNSVLEANFNDILSTAEDFDEAWNTLVSTIGDQIATSILDMGQAMESFGNTINNFYDKAASWAELSESEKMEFINDNAELFSGEGGAEMLAAFQSNNYAAIEEALAHQLEEKREQQLADVRRTLAIEEARVGEDRNEAYIQSLKEYEAHLKDTNNLFKASLELRLEQEQAQLDKYKEYLEQQQEALTESLEKRKEAYEKYFEDINQNKEDEEYEEDADRLIANISKLSSSTNADAMNKTAELTKQLEELEEARLQELRERAQEAVIENIDTTIEEINEKFDKLLESNHALLLAMQGELDNPLEFMTDMIVSKASTGESALGMEQYLKELQATYGSIIGNDVFENMEVREENGQIILNIKGEEIVLSQGDEQSIYTAVMEALRAVGLK